MPSHYREVSVEAMHSTANTRASADGYERINFGAVHGHLSLMGTEETLANTTPDSELTYAGIATIRNGTGTSDGIKRSVLLEQLSKSR